MDNSTYTPSAVTRLVAPAIMLALATWLLADVPLGDTVGETAQTQRADVAEQQRSTGLLEAGAAAPVERQRVAMREGQRQ